MSETFNDFVRDDIDTLGEILREICVFFIMMFTHLMTYQVISYDIYFITLLIFRYVMIIPLMWTIGGDICLWVGIIYFTMLSYYQRLRRKKLDSHWTKVKFNQKSKLY